VRIAIFHDYIGSIGGGERLVLTLARGLGADVITTDVNHDSIKKLGFEDLRIASLGKVLPVAPFKQIHASLLFSCCSFPDYDFHIFSGNWAHYAAARHRPNLWYCHTPVRAFYDLKGFVLENQISPLHRLVAKVWIATHSYFDRRSLKHIDKIITNSENTRKRIRRYYGREAAVVYPPVQTGRFRWAEEGSYWLSVNRLYPEKRIPLQIEAFRRMPEERLKVVGWYSQGDHARGKLGYLSRLPENVELLGSVSDEELLDLYAHCKGLICTAMDEDFGMTPVEAMAAGKPVVAVREGGYLESVLDGVTGMLVEPEAESIARSIRQISAEGSARYKEACRARAELFGEGVFMKRMREEIEETRKI
jgi:glycosyltransferase involved in cell wall biosynthesis